MTGDVMHNLLDFEVAYERVFVFVEIWDLNKNWISSTSK